MTWTKRGRCWEWVCFCKLWGAHKRSRKNDSGSRHLFTPQLSQSQRTSRGATHCWIARRVLSSWAAISHYPSPVSLWCWFWPLEPLRVKKNPFHMSDTPRYCSSAGLSWGSHACSSGLSPGAFVLKYFANLSVTFCQTHTALLNALLKMGWIAAGCHLDNRDEGPRRKENPSFMFRVTIRKILHTGRRTLQIQTKYKKGLTGYYVAILSLD